jgi:hypothetical protein
MMFYPEELLVPWASMRLARAIKWTEDRQENFYATTQERGQVHDAEMALTRDGRILGVRDTFLFDTGAYDPYGLTIPHAVHAARPYDIPAYHSEFTKIFTIKTIARRCAAPGGALARHERCSTSRREPALIAPIRRNLLGPDRFLHNHERFRSAPSSTTAATTSQLLEQAAATIYGDLLKTEAASHRTGASRRIACYVEAPDWPT